MAVWSTKLSSSVPSRSDLDDAATCARSVWPIYFLAFTFAHRAFCAAAIFFLAAALIFRLFFGTPGAAASLGEPKIVLSFFSSDWIFSLMPAARRNCFGERFINRELMPGN